MNMIPTDRIEQDDEDDLRRFQFQGKRVRLPDGRHGHVYMIEARVGGSRLVASVRIEGAKPWLFGIIKPKPVRFADAEIDQLVELPTEEEIQRILDDPEALGLED